MRKKMTPAQFVGLWNSSESLEEFCNASGYTPASARSLAARYRAGGMLLQNMQHNVRRPAFNADEFVFVCNSSATPAEAARRLGTTPKTIKTTASQLRAKGFAVKFWRTE